MVRTWSSMLWSSLSLPSVPPQAWALWLAASTRHSRKSARTWEPPLPRSCSTSTLAQSDYFISFRESYDRQGCCQVGLSRLNFWVFGTSRAPDSSVQYSLNWAYTQSLLLDHLLGTLRQFWES